ncbi:Inner membrane transport protein YeaN [Enterobacter intestinihominis]
MTTAIQPSGKQGALLVAGILMIATTLRVTFTGVAPLLDTIRQDYGLSTAQTGLLTTLPLLAFALSLPLPQASPGAWAWSAAFLSLCC